MSDTGVAGLTLGGGLGLTQRAFGLACDSVKSIQIVTADGEVRTADARSHPDLLWAARGGGRGLGVVTSFEFGLHPLGPQVAVAQAVFDYADAERVLRRWRDTAIEAPELVSPEIVLWNTPPDPALPEELHGVNALFSVGLYAGDPAEADAVLRPLTTLAAPVLDMSATVPYVAVQSSLDALVPAGGRYYFKSHFLDALTDEAIATLLAADRQRPESRALTVVRTLGGAVDRMSAEDSAFAHRGARFNLSMDGYWEDPADDATVIGWVRDTWARMQPFATGGVYVNFAGFEHEADVTVAATMGGAAQRLDQVRPKYDPDGVFSHGVPVR